MFWCLNNSFKKSPFDHQPEKKKLRCFSLSTKFYFSFFLWIKKLQKAHESLIHSSAWNFFYARFYVCFHAITKQLSFALLAVAPSDLLCSVEFWVSERMKNQWQKIEIFDLLLDRRLERVFCEKEICLRQKFFQFKEEIRLSFRIKNVDWRDFN